MQWTIANNFVFQINIIIPYFAHSNQKLWYQKKAHIYRITMLKLLSQAMRYLDTVYKQQQQQQQQQKCDHT